MSERDAALTPVGPVFLVGLFPGLHAELMRLLRGLKDGDWERPTACALWSVKDIAAHLLDGNLRRLSHGRDGLRAGPDRPPAGYADLVAYLNRLNAEWIAVSRRLSYRVLLELLDRTAGEVHAFFQSLDPHQPALFPVSWAGEDESANWFDIGREYTERWLHQQQIREAVGASRLSQRQWLHPTLDIFMRALPFTYRKVAATPGRSIRLEIVGDAGGVWTLARGAQGWDLMEGAAGKEATRVSLDQETAWKLFSKGLSPAAARPIVRIEGDRALGEPLLNSLAVMA
ncbi:MAG: maleylpyruvate isomerase N-terminal domain-containing protein [Gemmatimonadales bacterium]